jgi:hypothetical protein
MSETCGAKTSLPPRSGAEELWPGIPHGSRRGLISFALRACRMEKLQGQASWPVEAGRPAAPIDNRRGAWAPIWFGGACFSLPALKDRRLCVPIEDIGSRQAKYAGGGVISTEAEIGVASAITLRFVFIRVPAGRIRASQSKTFHVHYVIWRAVAIPPFGKPLPSPSGVAWPSVRWG